MSSVFWNDSSARGLPHDPLWPPSHRNLPWKRSLWSCDVASICGPGPRPTPRRGSRQTRPGHRQARGHTIHRCFHRTARTARADQARMPVRWTASSPRAPSAGPVSIVPSMAAGGVARCVTGLSERGAEACMRHAAGPGTNEVPAANLAMELVRPTATRTGARGPPQER